MDATILGFRADGQGFGGPASGVVFGGRPRLQVGDGCLTDHPTRVSLTVPSSDAGLSLVADDFSRSQGKDCRYGFQERAGSYGSVF